MNPTMMTPQRSSSKRDAAMARYLPLLDKIDADVARARKLPGYVGCPPNCHDCCHVASILPIGVVEIEPMLDALESFPKSLRDDVLTRATVSVSYLKSRGFDADTIMRDPNGAPASSLFNRLEAPCPFLIGGVCSVYDQRPLICRAWGVPLHNGNNNVTCCPKTFTEKTTPIADAVPYLDYWRKARVLSGSLEKEDKEPMAFLLLRKWRERRASRS
ncbi:MAG: YkgJ family cysteine cluster protein [Candidatus Poribacteria bacterium]|nr:YkgJ family cysteine cluster protein [Candidatus Poribacteria bacterium]